MKLLSLELRLPGNHRELAVSFESPDGTPRPVTVIYGGPGAGKTSLIQSLSCTRPGYATAMGLRHGELKGYARTLWQLGIDEPDRREPLQVISPNAPDEVFEQSAPLRREQVFFDRLARDGGFMFVAMSALRWFSKSPVSLNAAEIGLGRFDVRDFVPLDDASRQDLARECKQTLTYAAIGSALPSVGTDAERFRKLGGAVCHVVSRIVQLMGYRYLGVAASSLSPVFESHHGETLPFDALPSQLKHMVALGTVPLRCLWAAYPELEPRRAPGVVAVDQLEQQLEDGVASELLDLLPTLLPEVQWVVTTRSVSLLASRDVSEVFALRRTADDRSIRLYTGSDAQLH